MSSQTNIIQNFSNYGNMSLITLMQNYPGASESNSKGRKRDLLEIKVSFSHNFFFLYLYFLFFFCPYLCAPSCAHPTNNTIAAAMINNIPKYKCSKSLNLNVMRGGAFISLNIGALQMCGVRRVL